MLRELMMEWPVHGRPVDNWSQSKQLIFKKKLKFEISLHR